MVESKGSQDGESVEQSIRDRLLESLVVVDDPRSAQGRRYPIVEVLAMVVLGCMCGCDNAEALEDWARKEQDWLSDFLTMKHGTPSQDVFLRVLAAIEPQQFRQAFLDWVQAVFEPLGLGGQIAVDGQTHRNSSSRSCTNGPVHMVHALACDTGLVLGQLPTEEKSNEIRAIPALLELLDIEGALVSIDAMGTQRRIVNLIRRKKGDYLLGLKDNQSTLYEETARVFEEALDQRERTIDEARPPTIAKATNVDGGHGRIETRTAYVIEDFDDWVPSSSKWRGIKSLIAVEAKREDTISGKIETERRYYISSRKLSAEQANEAVRSHWLVENQLHWVLDVSFGQDASRVRTEHAAENLGVVRHFALNLIRKYDGDNYSVPRRRRLCDYDTDYREQLLTASTA